MAYTRTFIALLLLGLASCRPSAEQVSERFVHVVPEWSIQRCRPEDRAVFQRYQTATDPSEKLRAGLAALALVSGREEPYDAPTLIDFRNTLVKISQATWLELFGQPEKKLWIDGQVNYLEYDLGGEGSRSEPEWTMDVELYKGFVIKAHMTGQVD